MKTFLKKSVLVAIPLLLCILAISFKPVPAKATCYTALGQEVDCGDNAAAFNSADAIPAGTTNANGNANSSANPTAGRITGNPKNNPKLSYTLLEPLPCIPSAPTVVNGQTTSPGVTCPNGNGNIVSSVTFQQYLQFFFNLVIALSAAAAVFMIAAGGLRLMTTDSWTGTTAAKKQIQNAVIGLVIVLCSYFILQIIDPRLVAIPTTLVPPLNINYKGQTSAFFNDLVNQITTQDQGSNLKSQNDQLRSAVYDAQNQVTALNSSKMDIENNLADIINPDNPYGVTEDDINAFCNDSEAMGNGPGASDLCSQLNQNIQDNNTVQGDIALKTALFTMNTQIINCLGSGANSQTGSDNCDAQAQGAISTAQDTALKTLEGLGQTDKAEEVIAYDRYAGSMSSINNVLATLQTSPGTTALYNGIKQFNTTYDTALGTYLASSAMFSGVGQGINLAGSGGGALVTAEGIGSAAGSITTSGLLKGAAGAVAGETIANFGNNLAQGQINANDREAAATAANQISKIVASTQDTIQDPDLKAMYQKQTTTILNALHQASGGAAGKASTQAQTSPFDTSTAVPFN